MGEKIDEQNKYVRIEQNNQNEKNKMKKRRREHT